MARAVMWGLALGLALPPLLLPIYSSDLFMHLSAGRWMVEHAALPRAEFLSFTFAGAPWVDYEWLSDLIYFAVFSLSGLAGLWLLKTVLLAACALTTFRTVKLYALEPWAQAAAVVLWSAGILSIADLRPDLFSLLCFSALLLELETRRARPRPAWIFALFCLWANLHPGFALGLGLLAAYGAWSLLAAAFIGTLCNPYGLGPHRLLLEHWRDAGELSRLVQEWQPISLANRYYWPFWPAAALCLVLVKKKGPLGLSASALVLAWNAWSHGRFASFFSAAAVPLIAQLSRGVKRAKMAAAVGALAYALFLPGTLARMSVGGFFNDVFVPVEAAEFMAEERPVLEGLRIYNPWEWGGYLGFRLHPWHKVFADGRYYIFHGLLKEYVEALERPEECRALLERHKIDAALVRNIDRRLPMLKMYKDKTSKRFERPWYLTHFPAERWALVYWDSRALFFVDRGKAPKGWLAQREYRYVLPHDEEALTEAVRRREVPAERVRIERERVFTRLGRVPQL